MYRRRDADHSDADGSFFNMPLSQARQMSARITKSVQAGASPGLLLDDRGHLALREALADEIPNLSPKRLFQVGDDVGSTAYMLATAQWRLASHFRSSDTPEVDAAALQGALLIHLHAGVESPAARIFAEDRQSAVSTSKHLLQRRSRTEADSMARARLLAQHASTMYGYWRELLRD